MRADGEIIDLDDLAAVPEGDEVSRWPYGAYCGRRQKTCSPSFTRPLSHPIPAPTLSPSTCFEPQAAGHDGGAPSDDDDDDEGEMAEEEVTNASPEEDDAARRAAAEPSGPDTSIARFSGHADSVFAVAVAPGGTVAASGGGDDFAFLWSVDTGAMLHTLAGHTDSVASLAFSSDGAVLATGSLDGTARLWDTATGACLATLEGPSGEVAWVSWHPKGRVLLVGAADGTVWMWDATRVGGPGKAAAAAAADGGSGAGAAMCMQVFAGHEGEVTCGGFEGGGKLLVSGSEDGSVRLWSPKTGSAVHVFSGLGHHEGAPVNALAFHPEVRCRGRRCAAVRAWRV